MGFEPMNRFWRLHTFQACAFDHSAISPNYPTFWARKNSKKINNVMIKLSFLHAATCQGALQSTTDRRLCL